jgi:hypothetical protein
MYAVSACALALHLGIAAPALAESPPLDLEVQPADASATVNTDAGESAGEAASDNPQCAAFAADLDADVGDIIRAGCQPSTAQMSKLMDNPLGNVAMLFTQFDVYQMKDPESGRREDKYNYMGIFQFPKRLNNDWNLINRVVWNVPSMPLDQNKIEKFERDTARRAQFGSFESDVLTPPGAAPLPIDLFSGRTTGFGDMYYVGLFSPSKPIDMGKGKFVWGAGFDVMAPTASEKVLGTGKWGAGPSALGVYLGPKWKVGALVQQYWDFAGDSDRDNVNLMNLQYFYMYSLNETTSIGAAPNVIANFEQSGGNQWTVPVGLGINKTFQIGKVPVRFGVEAYYSAIKPDDVVGTEWNYRFYMIPAAPSALFKWMQ